MLALTLAQETAAQALDAIVLDTASAAQPLFRRTDDMWVAAAGDVDCGPDSSVRKLRPGPDVPVRIGPDDPSWRAVETAIGRVVLRRERDHRLTPAQLASVPAIVQTVFASPGRAGGERQLYFEAVKRLPDPGTAPDEDPRGTVRVVVSGWLLQRGEAIEPAGSKSELGWEQDQRAEPSRPPALLPLGVVHETGSLLWIMHGRAGSSGWFTLYRVGGGGVAAVAAGPRCRT